MKGTRVWQFISGKAFGTLPKIIDHEPPTEALTQTPLPPIPDPTVQAQHRMAFASVKSVQQNHVPQASSTKHSGFKSGSTSTTLGVIGKNGLANWTKLYHPQKAATGASPKIIKQGIAKPFQQPFWSSTLVGAKLMPPAAPGRTRS